jgi:hypothetical protein
MLQMIDPMPLILRTFNGKVAQEIVVYPFAIIVIQATLLDVVVVPKIVSTTAVVEFEPEWVVR